MDIRAFVKGSNAVVVKKESRVYFYDIPCLTYRHIRLNPDFLSGKSTP